MCAPQCSWGVEINTGGRHRHFRFLYRGGVRPRRARSGEFSPPVYLDRGRGDKNKHSANYVFVHLQLHNCEGRPADRSGAMNICDVPVAHLLVPQGTGGIYAVWGPLLRRRMVRNRFPGCISQAVYGLLSLSLSLDASINPPLSHRTKWALTSQPACCLQQPPLFLVGFTVSVVRFPRSYSPFLWSLALLGSVFFRPFSPGRQPRLPRKGSSRLGAPLSR